ncbi:MAG: nucleoside 2-deoxyribosyltransferase [Erysipelotrichaceae bacterium]
MGNNRYLIIGDIYVDTHVDELLKGYPLIRLGGIFHAVRAFSSINENFGHLYFAPSYLIADIEYYSEKLSSQYTKLIGEITNSPNVMVVCDSKELSSQGYLDLVTSRKEIIYSNDIEKYIIEYSPTDVLIYPGKYDLKKILQIFRKHSCKLHIDIQYDFELQDFVDLLGFETVLVSTSSKCFQMIEDKSTSKFIEELSKYSISTLVIKENRGGSLIYDFKTKSNYSVPAYISTTSHSVGVGDVYDVLFVQLAKIFSIQKSSKCASYAASIYAQTFDYSIFENRMQFLLKNLDVIEKLDGVRVPWDSRPNMNIYIAAPDFPDVNTELVEKVRLALEYHNFRPRLPIRENGLHSIDMPKMEELSLYYRDLELLESCDLLIAIILFNDPGTYVELGMFKQMNKPTIMYDPHCICKNMFAINSAEYYCSTLSEIINATFVALKGRA